MFDFEVEDFTSVNLSVLVGYASTFVLAKSTVKIEKARKRMNAAARSIFLCEGGGYIRHPSISIMELSLYMKDGVHLSTTGNAICVNDMQGNLNILYLGITKLSRGLILMRRAVIELFVWRDPERHSKV